MKVLLYSRPFPPEVGGIETIAVTLATELVTLGHECTVLTETKLPPGGRDDYPFSVVRAPSSTSRLKLARGCDVIHSNGASVAMFPYACLARKPFLWTHNGYQVECIDGLGIVDGEPSPVEPLKSIAFHFRKRGLRAAVSGGIRLAVRRAVARCVALNVACTEWVSRRLDMPRQVVAYTPYNLDRFRSADVGAEPIYDFIYVGRLVSEKGIPDLLAAFAIHTKKPQFVNSRLAIIGDGPMRSEIERSISQHRLERNVDLLGRKTGDDLVRAMGLGRIGVVPSRWEEPMGGVSLELLASGRMLIVSESGGHAECVRDVALTFPNGDVEALAECLAVVTTDEAFAARHRELAQTVLDRFNATHLAQRYVELYRLVASSDKRAMRKFAQSAGPNLAATDA